MYMLCFYNSRPKFVYQKLSDPVKQVNLSLYVLPEDIEARFSDLKQNLDNGKEISRSTLETPSLFHLKLKTSKYNILVVFFRVLDSQRF